MNEAKNFGKLTNLVNIVILNCVGSGLLMLTPRISTLGMAGILSWFVSFAGAVSIGIIFGRLAEVSRLSDNSLQNLIASQASGRFAKMLQYTFFWQYFTFSMLGNAVLSCVIVGALGQFMPSIIQQYSIFFHAAIFFLFYIINRFGVEMSENFNKIFTLIKLAILGLFPIIMAIFVKPKIGLPTNFEFENLVLGASVTLWPFVGIESIAMEKDADKKTLRPAILIGTTICLVIFLVNTFVMFTQVPNLSQSSSPYSDLFGVLFGPQLKWIVNLLIILVVLGSLQGWTHTSVCTAESGKSYLPSFLVKYNEFKVNEAALIMVSAVPFLFILFTQYIMQSESIFNTVLDIVTAQCLFIYASSALAFGFYLLHAKTLKILDYVYTITGLSYTIFALFGSSQVSIQAAILSILFFSGTFWINEARNKKLSRD